MTTPVNFELSKLLKEKGFDEPCRYVHDTWNNVEDWLEDGEGEHRNSHKNGSVYYSAPTIADVVMWLYEKHEIWISVEPPFPRRIVLWEYYVQNANERILLGQNSGYNNPIEAYEAAIKYTLENIIKQ